MSAHTKEQMHAVRDALAQALGDAYDCTRVWSAWNVGTMSQDDFVPVTEDDERLHELTIAALDAAASSQSELLADVEALYTELGDFENDWPGRVSETGQGLLISLRAMLAKATGRTEQEVQDDYGTRAARARAEV